MQTLVAYDPRLTSYDICDRYDLLTCEENDEWQYIERPTRSRTYYAAFQLVENFLKKIPMVEVCHLPPVEKSVASTRNQSSAQFASCVFAASKWRSVSSFHSKTVLSFSYSPISCEWRALQL